VTPEELERAGGHLAAFLASIGVGDGDDEMQNTPARAAEFFSVLLGSQSGPAPSPSRLPDPNADASPVYITQIPFHSMCAHHLVPFFGHVDVAYVPGEFVGGVGSFSKIVRHFSLRPQLQERLVRQIADHIQSELSPRGVLVRACARQLCMEMQPDRGEGTLVCSAGLGTLAVGGAQRAEVLQCFQARSRWPEHK
jgi:GTP cyclohydrolase I